MSGKLKFSSGGESFDFRNLCDHFNESAYPPGMVCANCRGGHCHGAPSNEQIPKSRRPAVDRAKPETTDDLIKESQRIRETVPRPKAPSILGNTLSPAEAEAMRERREKQIEENWRLEHGLGPEPVENKPHDSLDLYKFRREPKPVEKRKTYEEVIEKAREIQAGYAAAGIVGAVKYPELQALIARREKTEEQIKQYELTKEFDKQISPAYVKSLLKEMSYAQVQEQLQRKYQELKEEKENQNAR